MSKQVLQALKAVRDAIADHCGRSGDVIWISPPHQLPGVHESAIERLDAAIELIEEVDEQSPLKMLIDGVDLAKWLEELHRLHNQTPRVAVDMVAKNPADAMYSAVRDLQEQVGYVLDSMLHRVNEGRFSTFLETIERLRPADGEEVEA